MEHRIALAALVHTITVRLGRLCRSNNKSIIVADLTTSSPADEKRKLLGSPGAAAC